eukprot:CAMPEP_0167798146 /NCGR_PEP_ID=MMETSP0111_2-20121227/16120_1 /TAXON_ID=91324 /ORGANISM="Lotharella globosa, Strain CCCM811" /LENGTH=160 /DNA_ID=CAMNT_0007692475 /DNA_START=213 /DNA_END=691 /DNA_ORIENTATION=+
MTRVLARLMIASSLRCSRHIAIPCLGFGFGGVGQHRHLAGSELEVEEVDVGRHVLQVVALRDDAGYVRLCERLLHHPSKAHLCSGHVVGFADLCHELAVDERVLWLVGAWAAQRREAHEEDLLRLALRHHQVDVARADVVLDLVDSGANSGHFKDVIDVT